jgi:seryl-tRNA synthetase
LIDIIVFHANLDIVSLRLSVLQGIQTAITILKDFASQFSSLQVTNSRLQEEVASSSSKLDQAITIGANALREVDVLKKELGRLKKKMKEEEKAKAEAQTQ